MLNICFSFTLALTINADSELTATKREVTSKQLEVELWQNLAFYMSTEVPYTLKRLVPGDLKVTDILLKFADILLFLFLFMFSVHLRWTI